MGLRVALVLWVWPSVAIAAAPELPPPSEPPPAESAPPPSDSPPVQRPSTMPPPQPTAPPPAPVDTPPATAPPVTTPPVEPTPPVEMPTEAPPTATVPPRVAAPPPELPSVDPFEGEPPREQPRRISPAFRRPGAWLATGVGFLALGTILRFVFPAVTKVQSRCENEADGCESHRMNGGGMAILILSVPVDAMTMVSFGFAGRSYGLRNAEARRRAPAMGGGAALVVAGAALTIASLVVPIVRDRPDGYSYAIAGIRQAGITAGAAGAFLLGYGVASPMRQYTSAPQRRFVIAPSFGRTHVGLALTFRR